ncbi:MAG TPA: bifunctional UDP-N-acetylglucosamine diphosphorylase/glucosamine-1-phosphate N-acetyltransferase GlmU [Methylomirabilota bacterium]|nr:bifunctional UDP-N-acetylglucosamine diphosphorylase/glucosamine-1-phosphate N-acetyltransferase GlmU [Methylomirabilota bacterium]
MREIGVILLAAGQGTRMKSSLPKVLHPLGGKPLFLHAVGVAKRLKPSKIAVVIGHGAGAIREAYVGDDVTWVTQEQQLGTGHAVLCAKNNFADFCGDLLILSGDVPLIQERTLNAMVETHIKHKAPLTLLTALLDMPKGYGRILRDARGDLTGIVEEKDANDAQKQIREVNAGAYIALPQFLFPALEQVKNDNRQGEYYLPDVVTIGLGQGQKIATVRVDDPREMMGINTRKELARMEKTLQERINRQWMDAGVTLKDPQTTYIEEAVTIGRDTVIGPNSHLRGRTIVGERCQIDGSAYLTDAEIGDGVHLRFSVVLTGCRVDGGAIIGPFAHLRPGTSLGANVHIGNFVETKEAVIGEGTKANHLTYLGDVTIGRESNIGAGTITCNYDGFKKYQTKIGDRVQVGSDSTLVAPISLGDDVYVATATTIRHDIPSGALVFNERQERLREGWTEKKREQMKGMKK